MAREGFSSYEAAARRPAKNSLPPRARFAPVLHYEEHLALLSQRARFDRLLREDDLLDEGVAAVFTITGETAELVALAFDAGQFSAAEVAAWLTQRRLRPRLVVPTDLGETPP